MVRHFKVPKAAESVPRQGKAPGNKREVSFQAHLDRALLRRRRLDLREPWTHLGILIGDASRFHERFQR